MASKKPGESGKRKREVILLEVKQDIIRKHDQGMRVAELAREYGRNASTIVAIVKDKERIMSREPAKGVTVLTKNHPAIIDEVEKLLLLWIQEKERAGDTVTPAVACDKARALHADLVAQQPGTLHREFKASRGWFEKFKVRSGIRSIVRHEEAASSDLDAVKEFATEFFETVTAEGYLPEQVFNCDETGLFWERMPRKTFITQEETKMSDHKLMKDRLPLLFCANAGDDLKVHSPQEQDVIEEIDSMGQTRVLKVSTQDMEGLVERRNLELSTKDLLSLQEREQQGMPPDIPEEQVEEPTQSPLSPYKRACELWGELQTFVNDHSEDQAATQEAVEHFDSVVVAPWRAMLHKTPRQQTTDRFVVKQEEEPCCSSQLSPSASSSQK